MAMNLRLSLMVIQENIVLNVAHHIQRVKAALKQLALSALRRAMKKEAVKRHGGKCERCGYNKCIDALQFHHKDANKKEFGLANGITHSWEEYLAESMKCELLCANCHAEEHSKNNNIDR